MEAIKELKMEGDKVLKIYHDDSGLDPRREYSNLGKMVCFHNRYDLGDEHTYDYNGWDEMEKAIRTKEKPVAILPLYLYDHSGITMNTTGFDCNWDSGQVGFIFATKKEIDVMGIVMKNDESYSDYVARIEEYLRGEVKTYDQYLTGDVYGFQVEDSEGDVLGGCWGFYGDDFKENGLIDHAEEDGKVLDLDEL